MSSESPTPTPTKGSTIEVTTRHERSLYTHVLHIVIRPFRNFLGRPGKHQPKGSIELTPHKSASKRCTVKHRTVCDIHVYDILSKLPPENGQRKRIYYFCGGGWQSPPSSQHWLNCSKMASEVPGTTVSIVSYPLAPNNPSSSAFPWLMRFYRAIMEEADTDGEKVILAGDSAGGNIVLCLVLEALREDSNTEHEGRVASHPAAVMAICPSTDLTRSNPDIEKLAKDDPLLTPQFVKSTAKAWHGEWDPADRRVSPVNADIALLAKSGIHVHGITAGYDILSPDGILFRNQLVSEGVHGQWLHWEKQMHCFVLTQAYGVREAQQAIDWVMGILKAE